MTTKNVIKSNLISKSLTTNIQPRTMVIILLMVKYGVKFWKTFLNQKWPWTKSCT